MNWFERLTLKRQLGLGFGVLIAIFAAVVGFALWTDARLVRAEQWAREQGVDELMLIGGAQLYAQALGQAQRLYLTRIDAAPEGDAFFPAFDEAEWQCVESQPHPAEGEAPAYRFETWQKQS